MISSTRSLPGLRLGTIIVILFLSIFIAVGVFTGVLAAKAFLNEDFGQGAFLSIFSLVFGGFGIGMLVFMLEWRKKTAKYLELRASFPSEPWKWREDWASGAVQSSTKRTMWFAWAFSIFWNLISTPLLFVLPEEIFDKGNYPALLGLLFPLVGVGLLVWAIRETLEWKTFGQSILHMNSVPGVIGGEIGGTVDIRASFDPGQVFDVVLSCVNVKTTGSGKNSSTSEYIRWQERLDAVQPLARPEAMGSGIALRFVIPYDCQPTDDSNPNDKIVWRLETHAAVPGVDYHAQFEVPVYKTAASRQGPAGDATPDELPAQYQPTEGAGISFDVSPTGGTVLRVSPARATSTIVSLIVFFVVWTGFIVLMLVFGAPVMFPFIFGLFDLLFLYMILQLATGSYRIVIEGDSLTLENTVAGVPSKTVVHVEDIISIKPSIGMQSGKTVFYSIEIARRGGRPATLRVALREKHDAEWLAAELRTRIGARTPEPETSH